MVKSIEDLVQIARNGGGMRISAPRYHITQLVQLAAIAADKGGQIIITDLGRLSQQDLVQIAANGKDRIIFDFTT